MLRDNGVWKRFDTEASMDRHAEGYRVQKTNWSGPGWYYVTTYSQKCPRGCCYDSVIEYTSKLDRIYKIKEEMANLANLLKDARNK